MAVPGRRRSVPTDLNIRARDAPLPWGSGLGTLRVLPRKPRLNPPGFESPGLFVCVCVDAWARLVAAHPRGSAHPPSTPRSGLGLMTLEPVPVQSRSPATHE